MLTLTSYRVDQMIIENRLFDMFYMKRDKNVNDFICSSYMNQRGNIHVKSKTCRLAFILNVFQTILEHAHIPHTGCAICRFSCKCSCSCEDQRVCRNTCK